MSFVRVSVASPRAGHASDAARLMARILALCAQRPGYLGGALLSPSGAPRIVGRITLWSDREAADRTAQQLRMLALRSELERFVEEAGRHEHAFDAVTFGGAPLELADPARLAVLTTVDDLFSRNPGR